MYYLIILLLRITAIAAANPIAQVYRIHPLRGRQ